VWILLPCYSIIYFLITKFSLITEAEDAASDSKLSSVYGDLVLDGEGPSYLIY
jgi:hypothetical protein